MSNNIIIFVIIDFNNFIVSNFVDILQKKIDEIVKRRRIAFLRKTLRKTKIDEKIEFCVFVKFDEIFILSIRFQKQRKIQSRKILSHDKFKKIFRRKLTKFRIIFARMRYSVSKKILYL